MHVNALALSAHQEAMLEASSHHHNVRSCYAASSMADKMYAFMLVKAHTNGHAVQTEGKK